MHLDLLDDVLLPTDAAAPSADDAVARLVAAAVAATCAGAAHAQAGRWHAAEPPLRESVAMRERLHAEGDVGEAIVARGAHDLAVQRLAVGDVTEARALLTRARALLAAPEPSAGVHAAGDGLTALRAAVEGAWARVAAASGEFEVHALPARDAASEAPPLWTVPPRTTAEVAAIPPLPAGEFAAPVALHSTATDEAFASALPAWAALEPADDLEFLTPPAPATPAPDAGSGAGGPLQGAGGAGSAGDAPRTFVIPGLDAPPPREGMWARVRRRIGR